MKPYIYVAEGELTSPLFAQAFAAGSRGKIVTEYKPGPWAGFGSPLHWDCLTRARKEAYDFSDGDPAYFGRGKFYRVTKNRLQHTGEGTPNFERLRPFHETAQPWRKDGAHVVVCPQSQGHHDRFQDSEWLHRVLKILAAYTDRKIIIRTKKTERPLLQDLKDAWCLITHSSNSAVEAVLNGVPAIATGDCAASIMSLSDPANVENPYYPDADRLKWAAVLAANQWTLPEIAAGKCWKVIK